MPYLGKKLGSDHLRQQGAQGAQGAASFLCISWGWGRQTSVRTWLHPNSQILRVHQDLCLLLCELQLETFLQCGKKACWEAEGEGVGEGEGPCLWAH